MRYVCAAAATDVAAVAFVIGHLLAFGSQLCECIDHYAADDVAEQQVEENEEHQIGAKPHRLQLLNRTAYRPGHIQV